MRWAGVPYCRRMATRLALLAGGSVYFQRHYLADLNPRGFIALSAMIVGSRVRLGANVFIDDRVVICQEPLGGPVEIGDRVRLQDDTHIHTGAGGSVKIGADTHLHRGCQLTAVKAPIHIGCGVEIAARCAFYPYDHGFAPGEPIANQPLVTKGGITIEDEAWLGYGVIVLSGVRIGKGAVVGAGAVVTNDVPDGGVAVGVPAKTIRMRGDISQTDAVVRS